MRKHQRGFTLTELVIAVILGFVGIVVVVLSAVVVKWAWMFLF